MPILGRFLTPTDSCSAAFGRFKTKRSCGASCSKNCASHQVFDFFANFDKISGNPTLILASLRSPF